MTAADEYLHEHETKAIEDPRARVPSSGGQYHVAVE